MVAGANLTLIIILNYNDEKNLNVIALLWHISHTGTDGKRQRRSVGETMAKIMVWKTNRAMFGLTPRM